MANLHELRERLSFGEISAVPSSFALRSVCFLIFSGTWEVVGDW